MALTRNNRIVIAIVALFSIVVLLTANSAVAATNTNAKSVILPDKDSEDPSAATPQTPKIPDDALPKLGNDAAEGGDENPISVPTDEETSTPLAPVLRNIELLPEAVRKTHARLISAASRADLEALRALIGTGDNATTLSIGGLEGDPIEFLKETSGDADGYEVLAILLEVLEAGFVHVDAGTESEMYVWPYFFTWPFEKLTPQMKIELFRILTAGDVQDSADFGGYIFYRVGIRPNGQWDFFVAGD